MSIREFSLGDIVECEHCGKEFELNNLDEDEFDDFDGYFEHITTCNG
ncbi:hypothetical protein ACJ2A9_21420 [Anaerobacillus sp. MEB173]